MKSEPAYLLPDHAIDVWRRSRAQHRLRGLAQGQSNQEIAETLNIEKTTVRSHISNILNKLDVENRTQAALYAVELGLWKRESK